MLWSQCGHFKFKLTNKTWIGRFIPPLKAQNVYEYEFTYSIELSGVVITVVKANASAVDADINADAKVIWHEGRL